MQELEDKNSSLAAQLSQEVSFRISKLSELKKTIFDQKVDLNLLKSKVVDLETLQLLSEENVSRLKMKLLDTSTVNHTQANDINAFKSQLASMTVIKKEQKDQATSTDVIERQMVITFECWLYKVLYKTPRCIQSYLSTCHFPLLCPPINNASSLIVGSQYEVCGITRDNQIHVI